MENDREKQVAAILEEVKKEGDRAVSRLTSRFDGVSLTGPDFRVPPKQLLQAREELPPPVRKGLVEAARRIRFFHQQTRPGDRFFFGLDGELLGERWTPLASAGIYVPGGRAAYPSSVLMAAIPAQVAGVPRIAITTPPSAGGASPLVLGACALLGLNEVYQIGGVQAVGALAFGTDTVPAVDKIAGPGNAYVTASKKLLYGTVGIDFLAGPSEVVVISDETAPPESVALEVLAQAEHDPQTRVFCFTTGGASQQAVKAAIEAKKAGLPGYVTRVLEREGTFRHFKEREPAFEASDRIAPEHLSLKLKDPLNALFSIKHAGAVMAGADTPVAFGDYFSGPSHVLPTGGTAKFSSGLNTMDFMKCTHVIHTNRSYMERWGDLVAGMARAEGLEGHARSVEARRRTAR